MYPNTYQSGLASLGRNGDSMLVHMSPGEVAGLQGLALATGGTLTTNPYTGYPEASWLSNLIPSIASAALNTVFPNLGSFATSAIVAGATGLVEGSFEKGLRSGLQAYGTSKTFEGLQAASAADRAAKVSKLEELKKTVGADEIAKQRGPMDMFSPEYRATPVQTLRTPDIQAQIDKLSKEIAAPQKTGLGGLWQGVKAVGSPAGGQAFMSTLEGGQTNPFLRQLSRNAALTGILSTFTPEQDQPKAQKPLYYIPGAKNPLYGTGIDQPYYLPGTYSTTFPKSYADGGMVPADEGVIPARNQSYPMANIKSAGYSTATQRPRSAELLGGYDTAVDPFTGEEVKSQSNFADGGQVSDYLSQLKQQVTTPAQFNVAPPTAGPRGLNIYQAPYQEGWVPPAGIKDYYTALLSPPGGGRDTSALTDYLNSLNKRLTTPTAPTGPTGPTGPQTCPAGFYLNPQTLECEKNEPTTPPTPPTPPGPPPTPKTCPSGQIKNPMTGECEATAGPCPKGQHMEINDGVMVCVPDAPPPPNTCPPGSTMSSNGECVPDKVDTCPPGYEKDSTGKCKKAAVTPEECPPGSTMNNQGQCVPDKIDTCPPGYEKDSTGNCKKAKVEPDDTCPDGSAKVYNQSTGTFECSKPDATCPAGQHLDYQLMECVPDAPESCPEGYVRNSLGECKKATVTPEECPAGSTMNNQGQCVPDKLSTCPQGTVLDTDRMECVPEVKPCPTGYERDSSGNCKKAKVGIEECGPGQIPKAGGGCVDEDSFDGWMEQYGKFFPLPIQGAYLLWQKLKNKKVDIETCPSGSTMNDQGECVADKPPVEGGGGGGDRSGGGGGTGGRGITFNPAFGKDPGGSVTIEDIKEAATGGVIRSGLRGLAGGGRIQYAAGGKLLHGAGDGMSDDIPANINGNQEARLADGEFVVPADVVSHIGNGSTNAGAKKLYKMMADIRRARTGRTKQAPAVRPEKYMPRMGR